jgi:hypothetical protein
MKYIVTCESFQDCEEFYKICKENGINLRHSYVEEILFSRKSLPEYCKGFFMENGEYRFWLADYELDSWSHLKKVDVKGFALMLSRVTV